MNLFVLHSPTQSVRSSLEGVTVFYINPQLNYTAFHRKQKMCLYFWPRPICLFCSFACNLHYLSITSLLFTVCPIYIVMQHVCEPGRRLRRTEVEKPVFLSAAAPRQLRVDQRLFFLQVFTLTCSSIVLYKT